MPSDPAGLAVLTVTGDLDDETAGSLTGAAGRCLDQLPVVLHLDMSGVRFLSSAGVNALLQCRDAAAEAGCTLRVISPQPGVHRVLEIVGVLPLLGLGPAPVVPVQRPHLTGGRQSTSGETVRTARTARSDARATVRDSQSREKAGDILRWG